MSLYGFTNECHYKTEVEHQREKMIKTVRLDHGGEYYAKYKDGKLLKGPLADLLQDCGIIAHYTMSGTPEENDLAERRIGPLWI